MTPESMGGISPEGSPFTRSLLVTRGCSNPGVISLLIGWASLLYRRREIRPFWQGQIQALFSDFFLFGKEGLLHHMPFFPRIGMSFINARMALILVRTHSSCVSEFSGKCLNFLFGVQFFCGKGTDLGFK